MRARARVRARVGVRARAGVRVRVGLRAEEWARCGALLERQVGLTRDRDLEGYGRA